MDTRTKQVLIGIMAVFTVLAVTYSLVTRLKWGPDEPAHFIYVRSIATRFELPAISHTTSNDEGATATHEGHQPPLYYALMAIPFALLRAIGLDSDVIWRIIRLLNIPIGLAWIFAVYALCREFFGKTGLALAATAFVALIPTASYTCAVISNDPLIALLFTWAMIPMLVYFKSGEMSARNAAMLGALIGLAILAKAQGLILLPLFLLAALLVCRRSGYANWRIVLGRMAIVLGIAAAISGWWFIRNLIMHGELLPHSLYNPMLPDGFANIVLQPVVVLKAIVAFSGLMYGYFWVPFWLCDLFVRWFDYFYVVCGITGMMLIALGVTLRRGSEILHGACPERSRRVQNDRYYVDKRSLGYLVAAPALVYLSWLRYALMVDAGTNLQGRLFLCVASVIGIVWVAAFDGVLRSKRAKLAGLIVGLGVLALANIGTLICTLNTYAVT